MKIKYINNKYLVNCGLTIGKTYDVVILYPSGYTIIDNNVCECYYPKKYFKTLSEIIKERNDKINNLLVE